MVKRKNHKIKNIPGYNNPDKNVFSQLNHQYIGGTRHRITFERDADQLLHQYSNLIHKMGKKFGNINMSNAERQDLYAYISEVFVDLVEEFDMSNGMDFPGYIARMLPTRIRGSYLDPIQEYKSHISTLKDPNKSVEEIADLNYGKEKLTFGYSSKSKDRVVTRHDGRKKGVVSKAINEPNTNVEDHSLSEIHTSFRSEGYTEPQLHSLVDYIAKDGLTAQEARRKLKKRYKLDNEQVGIYYTQLVNLMKEYEKS